MKIRKRIRRVKPGELARRYHEELTSSGGRRHGGVKDTEPTAEKAGLYPLASGIRGNRPYGDVELSAEHPV